MHVAALPWKSEVQIWWKLHCALKNVFYIISLKGDMQQLFTKLMNKKASIRWQDSVPPISGGT